MLLHLGPNVITFRTLLHLGPNVITFRTLLHLGKLLHLGLQQGIRRLNDVLSDETTKTKKQTNERTDMTQPMKLDRSCHATTTA